MEKEKKEENKEGWTWLSNSRKWHYFVDGRALCGKFMLFQLPELEQGKDDSPDNCMACRKALEKHKAKLEKEST